MIIRRLFTVVVLLSGFSPTSLACSLVAGAEDPTPRTMGIAMSIFVVGLLVGVAHISLFIYRKGHNRWVFWITVALSLVITPVSFFLMIISGGTACGNGSGGGTPLGSAPREGPAAQVIRPSAPRTLYREPIA